MDKVGCTSTNSKKKKRMNACFVPMCKSTSIKYPNKVFFTMPTDPEARKKWFKAARRIDNCSSKTIHRCCEDHFNLQKDMRNYMEWKTVGAKKFLKPDAVPHIFNFGESSRQTEAESKRQQQIRDATNTIASPKRKPSLKTSESKPLLDEISKRDIAIQVNMRASCKNKGIECSLNS